MKIVLINPGFPYKGRDKFPIGLAYLASVAKEFGKVFVVDENVGESVNIKKIKPDYVGITSTTPSFPRALEIAKEIREYNNNIKIIFGGTHVSFKPEYVFSVACEQKGADIVVRGEGEETLKEILSGKDLKEIKGISYWNGKIINNPERELIDSLDSLQFPAYELFDLKRYEIIGVISSRGCPYSCSYCCSARFWKRRVRFRSPENFIEELKILKESGIKKIKIHDSTFSLDIKRAKRICELIIKEKLDFAWSCETRADCVDRELLEKMKKSGCRLICIGVDSGSQKVLDRNNRNISLGTMRKTFLLAKKIGLRTRAYVVFGLKGENESTVEETVKFLKEIKPDQIMLSLATSYPGTDLYGREIVMPEEWVKKFQGHGFGGILYFPESLSKEEYKKLADFLWKEIKKLNRKV